MARPYLFLMRKYKQLDRSQYEQRRYVQTDMFHALFAQLDVRYNKGKQVNKILLNDYEDAANNGQGDMQQVSDSKGQTQSSKLFKKDDFDPFGFM
uniref:hypothetical protein n=2 Tax=Staphylococcus aureus TaxID=1280 RepID=UPI0020BF4092